jgi:DeoR family fructose operon transcriptional repressor
MSEEKQIGKKKLPYVRRQKILELLKQNEFMEITQFSKEFDVSYMTILRDIEHLESSGEVKRVYGGVELAKRQERSSSSVEKQPGTSLQRDYTIEERVNENAEWKEMIGRKAAELVLEGDCIGMDASTSLLPMCQYLQNMHILVVTNSLSVALMFSSSTTVEVILLGGFLRKSSITTVGHYTADMMKNINLNKCFVSSKSLSFEQGMTDLTIEEPETKRSLINHSGKVYVLMDHTKINRISPFKVCDSSQIDALITDDPTQMDESQIECIEKFRNSGVEILFSNTAGKNEAAQVKQQF